MASTTIKYALIEQIMQRKMKNATKKYIERAVAIAKANVVVNTGALRDSIHAEDTENGANFVAGTDHALIVEFGSAYQEPKPFARPALEQAREGLAEDLRNS